MGGVLSDQQGYRGGQASYWAIEEQVSSRGRHDQKLSFSSMEEIGWRKQFRSTYRGVLMGSWGGGGGGGAGQVAARQL